jgi:hypothetical protein
MGLRAPQSGELARAVEAQAEPGPSRDRAGFGIDDALCNAGIDPRHNRAIVEHLNIPAMLRVVIWTADLSSFCRLFMPE